MIPSYIVWKIAYTDVFFVYIFLVNVLFLINFQCHNNQLHLHVSVSAFNTTYYCFVCLQYKKSVLISDVKF